MVCSGNRAGTNTQESLHKSQVCQIIDITEKSPKIGL